jgi:hypothetical protein
MYWKRKSPDKVVFGWAKDSMFNYSGIRLESPQPEKFRLFLN